MRRIGSEEGLKREQYYVASQWQLIWRKFSRHKMAMVALPVLGVLYFMALFPGFVGPYDPLTRFFKYVNAPPQRIRFFDEAGNFYLRPFVYDLEISRDPVTLRTIFDIDKSKRRSIYFFVRGGTHKILNLFQSDIHLFGTEDTPVFLFGTDKIGRDLFSRTTYGSQISLSIGLVGIGVSFLLGISLGGIAGYFGGIADGIIMRMVDLLISLPTIPIWMALAAAIPLDWPVTKVYFTIIIILSIIGWTGLARVVRGKLLTLREEDFITAARISGASSGRVIARHLLPSFASYLIVHLTLSVPSMILGETALSFLGLGLKPPAISWGVLLMQAQELNVVAHSSWLLIPCVFVITTVLMFSFLGDGLRDAADPYK